MYENIDLAVYLTFKCNILVTDQIEMFAYRCEMNDKTIFEMSCYTQTLNNKKVINGP